MEEQLTLNQRVVGSSPSASTIFEALRSRGFFVGAKGGRACAETERIFVLLHHSVAASENREELRDKKHWHEIQAFHGAWEKRRCVPDIRV